MGDLGTRPGWSSRRIALDGGADADNVLSRQVRFVAQRAEDRARLLVVEDKRRVELGDLAAVHDEDAVVVDDRVQAVGDGKQCRGGELGLDRPLDLGVRLNIDTASCLVLKTCSCQPGGWGVLAP